MTAQTITNQAITTQTMTTQAMTAPTQGFTFNHTMLRVKDPQVSLKFYQDVLGMTLLLKRSYADAKFDLYFLAKLTEAELANLPTDEHKLAAFTFSQRGILELTHNYGTESQAAFHYHDGNAQPQGFGHICFSVLDLAAAVAWFDQNNVVFKKRPEDGMMKNIAFIKDPDGYWIEIVQATLM